MGLEGMSLAWFWGRLGLVGVLLATVVVANPADPASAQEPSLTWTSGQPCPDAIVVGVAGSGQRDPRTEYGMGVQVDDLFRSIVDVGNDLRIAAFALPYPAAPVYPVSEYWDSADLGTQALPIVVGGIARECPETGIVLVGYSQGAQVIQLSLDRIRSTNWGGGDHSSHIDAVVLIASPAFKRQAGLTQFGSFDPAREGLLESVDVPGWIAGDTITWCNGADPVCQGGGIDDWRAYFAATTTLSTHFAYWDNFTKRIIGSLVVGRLDAVPAAPAPVDAPASGGSEAPAPRPIRVTPSISQCPADACGRVELRVRDITPGARVTWTITWPDGTRQAGTPWTEATGSEDASVDFTGQTWPAGEWRFTFTDQTTGAQASTTVTLTDASTPAEPSGPATDTSAVDDADRPLGPAVASSRVTNDILARDIQYPQPPDTRASSHREGIARVLASGVMSGYADGSFAPAARLTRAQAATMLVNAFELPPIERSGAFTDTAGTFHDRAIGTAADAGLVNGFSDGSFRPDETVTRAQFVSMLANGLGLRGAYDASWAAFDDVSPGNVHRQSIMQMARVGLVAGVPDGSTVDDSAQAVPKTRTFAPDQAVTRGQAATLVARSVIQRLATDPDNYLVGVWESWGDDSYCTNTLVAPNPYATYALSVRRVHDGGSATAGWGGGPTGSWSSSCRDLRQRDIDPYLVEVWVEPDAQTSDPDSWARGPDNGTRITWMRRDPR